MRPRKLSMPTWSERIRERRATSSEPSSIGIWTRRPSLVTTTATRRRSIPFELRTVRAVYGAIVRCATTPEVRALSPARDPEFAPRHCGGAWADACTASFAAASGALLADSARSMSRGHRCRAVRPSRWPTRTRAASRVPLWAFSMPPANHRRVLGRHGAMTARNRCARQIVPGHVTGAVDGPSPATSPERWIARRRPRHRSGGSPSPATYVDSPSPAT